MALQHLPEMAVFIAEPRPGSMKHFTFDEYLAWYEHNGSPRTEHESIDMFLSLCGENARAARVDAWSKVVNWRNEVSRDDEVYRKARDVLTAYHDRN